MKNPLSPQKGFTLVEILVGLIIGLVATAATVSLVTGIVRSNADNLKAIRLNQELRAVMDIMTRDLKRAGYWRNSTGRSYNNIFMTSTTGISFTTSQITFSYDADDDGTVDANEYFGFQRNLNASVSPNAYEIRSRTTQAGNWEAFTDPRVVNIATLTFTDQSQDLDADGTIDINYIGITLSGALVSDSTVRRTLTELVRVRNNTDTP